MIAISLSQGQTATVSERWACLAAQSWYAWWCKETRSFYAIRNCGKGKTERLHRAVMGGILGRPLTRLEYVDHVNHDTLDCSDSNLRLASHAENVKNARRRADNTSGFKGVHWNRVARKWTAQIQIGGKRTYLGQFGNVYDAAITYDRNALKHYGEFASTNFHHAACGAGAW